MTVELQGTVTDIFPVETIGAKGFQKKVFWLKQEDTEQYPQHWQLELHKNSISLLDKIQPGDKITCSVNIRGRYYKNHEKAGVINTLQCWKIIKDPSQPAQQTHSAAPPEPVNQYTDDLPF